MKNLLGLIWRYLSICHSFYLSILICQYLMIIIILNMVSADPASLKPASSIWVWHEWVTAGQISHNTLLLKVLSNLERIDLPEEAFSVFCGARFDFTFWSFLSSRSERQQVFMWILSCLLDKLCGVRLRLAEADGPRRRNAGQRLAPSAPVDGKCHQRISLTTPVETSLPSSHPLVFTSNYLRTLFLFFFHLLHFSSVDFINTRR